MGELCRDSRWFQRERTGLELIGSLPHSTEECALMDRDPPSVCFSPLVPSFTCPVHQLFPFPADTTSLPVSILLTGKFTYSSGGLHPFLHFFDVLLFIFSGYFICLCLLNFLVLPQDLVLYPLLLSTKHLAHPGLVFQVAVLFNMSPLQHWILFSSCLTQMVSVSSQAMLGLKFIESMSIPLIC